MLRTNIEHLQEMASFGLGRIETPKPEPSVELTSKLVAQQQQRKPIKIPKVNLNRDLHEFVGAVENREKTR
jgi:hypothetical protein